uniref:Uncharacterized protein n=1 Tax=Parastrongyloides trichosuri TaxID=131310 RepID=A0A0N4Z7G5_PARTI
MAAARRGGRAHSAGAGRHPDEGLGHGGPPLRRRPGQRLPTVHRAAGSLRHALPGLWRHPRRHRRDAGRRGQPVLRPDDRQADRPPRQPRSRRRPPGRRLPRGRGLAGEDQRRLHGALSGASALRRGRRGHRLHRGGGGEPCCCADI